MRTDADLQALRTRWVGRKGSWVAAFMERVGKASPEEKRELGRQANELNKRSKPPSPSAKPRSPRRAGPPARSTSRCPAARRSSATAIR